MSTKTRLAAALPSQRTRTVGAFTALTVALATLALLHDGVEVEDLHLHDGGVWVTNLDADGVPVAAHLNYQSREIDSFTELASSDSDLTQEANDVVLHDARANGVASVETSTWAAKATAQLPRGAVAAQGSGVLAVTDPNTGSVWAVPAADSGTFDPAARPVLGDEVGVRTVVGKDDVIHTVSPDGTLVDARLSGTTWTTEEVGSTPPIDPTDDVQLTAVGGTGVVLNRDAGWVAWPGHRETVDDAGSLLLQQPGDDAGVIALSGPSSLVQVPLGGGDPVVTSTPAGGTAVQPVTVGSCVYAAWSGSAAFVRDCADDADDQSGTHPEALGRRDVPGSHLVFRTNRDVVVLNDTADGTVILVNEAMEVVDDWRTVLQQLHQDDKDDRRDETIDFHREKDNHAPTAKDDAFGVRAGTSVTLPVLGNDTDPDGDVLTLSLARQEVPGLGRLDPVRDGRAVRVTVDEDATSGTFGYTADDGRPKGTDTAEVAVTVRAPDVNDGSRLVSPLRPSALTIRSRGTGEHHLLQEWIDKDGDPIWIDDVDFPKGTTGTFRPDGLVRVEDNGVEPPGRRTVQVTLTDGTPGGTQAVDLDLTVKPVDGRTQPVAQADFVTAQSGEDVTVRPLLNDEDPGGDGLYLELGNRTPPEVDVTPNADGSLTLRGRATGTYYVDYSVTDGTDSASSVIRVDVVEPDDDARPVPDNDLAVVPPTGEVLVPVLSNDTDPLGGVLVLESVNLDGVEGATAEVVDHETLRIRDNGLSRTVTIPYRVSNAAGSASGFVTVVPDREVPRGTPVAVDDEAVVRSGDVVSVDVLANDISPSDQPLTVLPDVEVTKGKDLGEAFVSEGRVRFRASGDSGEVRIRYDVADPRLNADSAIVRVTIQPASGSNTAPLPGQLTARMFQGGEAEIQVPLDGIDPDGDSVTLLGIQQAPRQGVVEVSGDTLTYTASQLAIGTDAFTYLVEDPYGAQAEGQVQVGIAEPPATNQPPIALPDERTVRTDRLVAVPVTANDIDPEGEELSVAGVEVIEGDGVRPEVVDGRIQLRTPADATTVRLGYTVKDKGGATATGDLVVKVDPDAPALPPIARDDRVPLSEIVGRTSVTVDVLLNDEDTDGAVSELETTVSAPGVTVGAGQALEIPLRPERQVVLYSVTDPDGEQGSAVVVVPGTDSDAAKRPVLRRDADVPIPVKAGESVEIPVAEYVAVRQGREASLPFTENIHAGPGHDGSDLKPSDEPVVVFGAAEDFYGPTAVTATVSDAKGDGDGDAAEAVITFPIYVEASGNTRPRLRIPEIAVAPEEPWAGELALLATDPDPGDEDLEFTTDDVDPGLDVEVTDDELRVSLAGGARAGSQLGFTLTVTDGHTAPVSAEVVVQVLRTTRPLIQVRPAELEAEAGETTTIDVRDYATNPFEDQGEDIDIATPPSVVSGDAEVDHDGTEIEVTPADDFSGTAIVTYVVEDFTKDAARQVQGQVVLDVRGRPDPPSTPTAEATESRTVQVDWRAGDNNGAPITRYRIEWKGGGQGSATVGGTQTSYTARGLTNAKAYQFRVVAINEVDESEPSDWSREATPDQVPSAPDELQVSFHDGSLDVSWHQPPYEGGSRVHTYDVRYNGRRATTNGATHITLGGLTNGTPYEIKVRGINDAEAINDGVMGAGEWSATVTEHPNGEPTVGTVEIDADGPDKDPSALISWPSYDDDGHPVGRYEVRRKGGGVTECRKVSPSSCRVALREGEQSSFQVRLFNRDNPKDRRIDGWSEWSGPTAVVRGAKPPGPVRNLRATPTGSSGQARITFSPADAHGAESVEYHYAAGSARGTITSGGEIGGLTDGSDVTVRVWAVTTANGKVSDPGPVEGDGVSPFAPCTVSVSPGTAGYKSHTFSWSVAAHGRDCRWSGDADGNAPSGSGPGDHGTQAKSGPEGGTVTLTVTVTTVTRGDDPDVAPASDDATGDTWRPEIVGTDAGAAPDGTGNCRDHCRYFGARISQWEPGGAGYCPIEHVGAWRNGETWWYRTGSAGSDGSWSGRLTSRSGRALAWNTTTYGSDPPYAGACRAEPPAGANVD